MNIIDKIKNNVYIIAEMSANHGGSLDNALAIVDAAKDAGADCVKIQTYTADTLSLNCNNPYFTIKGGLWDGYTYYDLYKEAYTPWEWHKPIKERCDQIGIDFLSTPFDFTAVDFLEELDIEFYKIASFELVDIPLIEYVASKGKPIIISCGMGSIEEIQDAIDACKRHNNDQIVLLKCCSQYPAKFENMRLSLITDMQNRFGTLVGLSDHSEGSLAPIIATSLGAKVIEKHVCLNKIIKSADMEFSMEMSEFKIMVEDVRNTSLILGKPTYELAENEKRGLDSRRSLFATKEIKKGDLFTKDNIRSVRPATGLKPKYYKSLLGKQAKNSYFFGDPLLENECK